MAEHRPLGHAEQAQGTAKRKLIIRRPREADWPRIMEVLKGANFHHIGGPEMPSFPLSDCFVAELDGRVVGVGGYRILDATTAKTTLLAVDPACRGASVGAALQSARQDFLRQQGIKELHTNADDERVIAWYIRRFGYQRTGERVPKLASFGRDDKDEWVSLKTLL